jgi:hypothetical protein
MIVPLILAIGIGCMVVLTPLVLVAQGFIWLKTGAFPSWTLLTALMTVANPQQALDLYMWSVTPASDWVWVHQLAFTMLNLPLAPTTCGMGACLFLVTQFFSTRTLR